MKGGLMFIDKWELQVFHSPKYDTLQAGVKIDRIRYVGNEGEAIIGDPSDFSSYHNVKEVLGDPNRRR
jgi:hypothetical protein